MRDLKDMRQYIEAVERHMPGMSAEEMLERLRRIYSRKGFDRVREAARIELEEVGA